MKNKSFFVIALLSILIQSAFSQGYNTTGVANDSDEINKVDLDEVVVTATRTPHSIYAVPASISTINKTTIEKSQLLYTDEVLRGTTGVFVRRSKPADQTGYVSLRGFSGSARTLVLLDGIPMNDSYNQSVNWRSVPTDAVSRVEIVKGSFSSLYGGSAMGGVINVMTEMPDKETISLKANYGTHNTFNVSASYGNRFLKSKKLAVFFNVSQISSDGYPTNFYQAAASNGAGTIHATGSKKTTNSQGAEQYLLGHQGDNWQRGTQLYGKILYDIRPGSLIEFSVSSGIDSYGYNNSQSYLKDEQGRPVNSGRIIIEEGDNPRGITISPYRFLGAPGNQYTNVYRLHYKTNINNTRLSSYVGLLDDHSWYETILSGATADGGAGRTFSSPRRNFIANVQADIPVTKHLLTAGVDYKISTASMEEWNLTNWRDRDSKTDFTNSFEGKQTIIAPYIQAEINIAEGLKAYLGVRYDHWFNADGNRKEASSSLDTVYANTSTGSLSPKLGLVYTPEIGGNIFNVKTIRASAGQSFRTPTLYNLYRSSVSSTTMTLSNPDLKPESAFSWDIGFTLSLFNDYTKISFDYYQSYLKDLIYTSVLEAGPPRVSKSMNAAKGEIKGFEVEVNQTVLPFLDLIFNLNNQKTKIKENTAEPATEGKRFTNVPDLIYNIGLNLYKGPLSFSMNYNFTGKFYSNSENLDIVQGVYTAYDEQKFLDGRISYNYKNYSLLLSVNNILDREQYMYYKSPGRTFTVGVNAKF